MLGDSSDDLLAVALAGGKSYPEAATAAGVSVSTVHRRMATPEFRERVEMVRVTILERAVGLITDRLADAAAQIGRVCQDGEAEANRLRAAVALFEIARKWFAEFHLLNRLRRLEETLGIGTPPAE